MSEKILVLGASGQIGTDLVEQLRSGYGNDAVVASDIKDASRAIMESGPFEVLDAKDGNRMLEVIQKHGITQVYHLVAMLSATAEKFPEKGWELNMESLFHTLKLAKDGYIHKLYWPSSIAAFGPTTPRTETPQFTVMDPGTVYGISKLSGELWCDYYHKKYGVDVRSIRYPGLISYKTEPGGGTTDYAVDIFHKALKDKRYECYLAEDTALPMMYMPDAIKATIGIMEAPAEEVKIRTSYNLSAFSFDPKTLAGHIRKHIPEFEMTYHIDHRNDIALGWPQSIDDSRAREDWGWKNDYGLEDMVSDMLKNLK
ncbi:MAG: NAD-dependent epimerase [Owenweeksia sp.]|nr:NAD-dependent epimerase [Owenweeksia sp.]MBF99397.1 NAD-dependent epimerase [Owenweeksia sp.]HBF21859.1 NAD-dependent epimerase [Cryomorphaceae bacterium]|tara:strand:- start:9380 stop:10318 length:939 start_codon:yes stop_codon:yes gene_type:complete